MARCVSDGPIYKESIGDLKSNIDNLAELLGKTKDEVIALYSEICANVKSRPSTYDVFQFFQRTHSQSAKGQIGTREAIEFGYGLSRVAKN